MVTARAHSSGRRRRRERGYTLVVVAMLVTVMTIAVAVVLPAWSGQIRREREEELVFRGLQYAEAIRVFQRRFGRFPNDLKELIEVKPRSIRHLWTEPLTEDGTWVTIPLNDPSQTGVLEVGPDGRPIMVGQDDGTQGGKDREKGEKDEKADDEDSGNEPPAAPGPIIGVRSANGKSSFRTFFGMDVYRQWRFTYDLVVPGGGGEASPGVGMPGFTPGPARIPRAAWIGRPLPGVEGQPGMPPGVQPGLQPPGRGGPGGAPAPPSKSPAGKGNG